MVQKISPLRAGSTLDPDQGGTGLSLSGIPAGYVLVTDGSDGFTLVNFSGTSTLRGAVDCSTNPNYPSAVIGDAYYVSVAGKIGGAGGIAVIPGDLIICVTSNAGGTQAAVGADWIIEQAVPGALLVAKNLSDVANAVTALSNLGGAALAGLISQEFSASNLIAKSINSGSIGMAVTTNGDMRISQIYEGASFTNDATPNYIVDRWFQSGAVTSKFSGQQVADAPNGLVYSAKFTVVAQYAPIGAEAFQFTQRISGSRISKFEFGTTSAQTITVYGWIKASVPGNYSVALRNAAANRSYVATIAATAVWTQWSITLTADTTGTWPTTNANALSLIFSLGAGGTLSTTPNTWQAGNYVNVTGNLDFVNQVNGSTIQFTGIDIVAGSVAPTYFPDLDYSLELAECQRYVEKSFPQGTAPAQNAGTTGSYGYTAALVGALSERSPTFPFKVSKYATPTMTYYNPSAANAQARDVTGAADCSATATLLSGDSGFSIVATGAVGTAVGNDIAFHWLAVSAR